MLVVKDLGLFTNEGIIVGRFINIGNFFGTEEECLNELECKYQGTMLRPYLNKYSDKLRLSFKENNKHTENWSYLAKHGNNSVRTMVVMSAKCLELLSNDIDKNIRRIADNQLLKLRSTEWTK